MTNASLMQARACSNVKSKPEKIANWLFKTSGNWRHMLGFAVISGLTIISICFNVQLAKLSAVDETSRTLLPIGYGLLDCAALFLAGYVGIKSKSPLRKLVSWFWFSFLLCLSLWAAAAFTLSVDYRQTTAPIQHQIEQKQQELKTQQETVRIWQDNVSNAVVYKTKHQRTLRLEQESERKIQNELASLEQQLTPSALVIYEKTAPHFGITAESLQLIIRLAWAFALVICPLFLVLLVAAEMYEHDTGHNGSPSPSPKGSKRKGFTNWFHKKGSPKTVPNVIQPSMAPVASTEPDLIQPKKRTSKKKSQAPSGLQCDTGTVGKAGNRYVDVKKAVLRGSVKPSIRKIREYSSCSQPIAQRYIQQMSDDGIIEKSGQGWRLRKLRMVKG